jgi:hypothetical protein
LQADQEGRFKETMVKHAILLVGCLLLALILAGCGSSGESAIREQIHLMNELADALEAGAPQAKLDEISKKMADNGKKLEALSEDERKKLVEKHSEERANASMRLANALLKNAGKQLGNMKVPDLSGLMNKGARKK